MSAPASAVRTFAREHGYTVGARGKFSAEVVKAFNKGKRKEARYDEGAPETRPVKVGRKTVQVNGQAARAWAVQQGLTEKTKGRLPNAVVQAYAETLV